MNHAAWDFAKKHKVKMRVLNENDTVNTIPEMVRSMSDRQLCHSLFGHVDWDLFSAEPSWIDAYSLSELNLDLTMMEIEKRLPIDARYVFFIHNLQKEFGNRFFKLAKEPSFEDSPTGMQKLASLIRNQYSAEDVNKLKDFLSRGDDSLEATDRGADQITG